MRAPSPLPPLAEGDPVQASEWLRRRFSRNLPWSPVMTGDGQVYFSEDQLKPAAVLVPIVRRQQGLTVLFTRRSAHLNDHAGQISFPGGRTEPGDGSPEGTALRETREEIGLEPGLVEVLGALHEFRTVTGYRVTPVVGLVSTPFELDADEVEVAEVFEVPLAYLMDPGNQQRNSVVHDGQRRYYFAMPYGRHYIWGATAGMVMNLHAFLSA